MPNIDTLKYSEILQLNREMLNKAKGSPYRVKLLSNVTVNSIKELLEYVLRINQINPVVELGNYDNVLQDSAKCDNDDLVIIFYNIHNTIDSLSTFIEDTNDELYNNIKEKICSEIAIVFENLKSSPSVIFNLFSSIDFITSYSIKSKIESLVSDLNDFLSKVNPQNVDLVNIDKIIAQIGVNNSFDLRLYHSSKAPYTISFFKKYISSIEAIIFRNIGKLKKAIIFDCDNTLWKGILGEDGFENIDMSLTSLEGKIFNRIQQIAVFLEKHGVIIGLCSKNNETDVSEVLMKHSDIVLTNNFITIKKINWVDKATNLKSIASELNIGLDSIIYVDDSSFEINLIKEQLPEIVTLQVPKAIYEYSNCLLQIVYKYFNLSFLPEDGNRTELYKQQFERESLKNKFESIDDYLSSLNISLTVYKDEPTLNPRIAQLTQKTNQFNLTTKRYTENQINTFVQNRDDFVFAISVKDKFGDSGITGLCIIKKDINNNGNAIIDTFLMSCRIIGRNIELAFMDDISDWLIDQHFESLSAEYNRTKKNDQVENFYDELGFNLDNNNDESKKYSINLKDYKKNGIPYITVKNETNKFNHIIQPKIK